MHSLEEYDLVDPEFLSITHQPDCTVYHMINIGGEGTMVSFEVFDGVELVYNDFHSSYCVSGKGTTADVMEINHCRRGRFECDFLNGTCVYLEEGDLSANMVANQTKSPCFPLEYYSGVSVLIDLKRAEQSLSGVLKDISIDLYALQEKLCAGNNCFIMRATDSIQHIFSELYKVPDQVKFGYFKLKVLELLLFLSVINPAEHLEEPRYYQKNHVECVKRMKNYMVCHSDCHFTLQELSERFDLPMTTMKQCFKGIYGTSVYAYMRSYRMQRAAVLLCQSEESVSSVAWRLGYVNASKFAAAFKKVIGFSPLEYRKKNRLNGVEIVCAE
ncbi:helix-turn-helix domain-containing protein [Faecalispora anaeroviscerum]|uniref:helix-turn-helix domain-containing protein n=1 Tax=Faecalispora anaeroviscerum TaxID=2991836 RepID=UPI0024BB96E0|nr:AraC family transcriptional regulator [Faecalispora anaeroviscerum]